MSERSDELFRKARVAGRPTADDLARVRGNVDRRIAAIAAASGAMTAKASLAMGSIPPKAIVAGSATMAKAFVVLGLAGAVGAAVMYGAKNDTVDPAPAPLSRTAAVPSARASTPSVAPPVTVPLETATPITSLPDVRLVPTASDSRASVVREAATHAPASTVAPGSAALPTGEDPPSGSANDRLAEEVAWIREADAELRRGDAAASLALFERHAAVHPNGALAEEREAGRIAALCTLSRVDEAKRSAAAFRTRYPRSMGQRRIDASCAGTRVSE